MSDPRKGKPPLPRQVVNPLVQKSTSGFSFQSLQKLGLTIGQTPAFKAVVERSSVPSLRKTHILNSSLNASQLGSEDLNSSACYSKDSRRSTTSSIHSLSFSHGPRHPLPVEEEEFDRHNFSVASNVPFQSSNFGNEISKPPVESNNEKENFSNSNSIPPYSEQPGSTEALSLRNHSPKHTSSPNRAPALPSTPRRQIMRSFTDTALASPPPTHHYSFHSPASSHPERTPVGKELEVMSMTQEILDFPSQIDALNSELAENKKGLLELERVLADRLKEKSGLESALTALRSQLCDEKEEWGREKARLREEIKALERRSSGLEEEIAHLTTELSKEKDENERLEGQIRDLKEEMAVVSQKVTELSQSELTLKSSLTVVLAEKERLAAETTAEAETLTTLALDWEEKCGVLEQSLQLEREGHLQLQEQLQTTVTQVQEQQTMLNETIAGLRKDLEEAATGKTKKEKMLTECTRQLEESKARSQALADELASALDALAVSSSNLTTAAADRQTMEDRAESAEAELGELKVQYEELKVVVSDLRAKAHAADGLLQEREQSTQRLEREVKALGSQLQHAEAERAHLAASVTATRENYEENMARMRTLFDQASRENDEALITLRQKHRQTLDNVSPPSSSPCSLWES
eukprot:GCRY01004250.1.p1 GENE.GCRY01004250.1~~GCRY01004250.1.p1  ORF type:complete len:641 (+),score=168.58 GCRY01004250.1:254-2176(+)